MFFFKYRCDICCGIFIWYIKVNVLKILYVEWDEIVLKIVLKKFKFK